MNERLCYIASLWFMLTPSKTANWNRSQMVSRQQSLLGKKCRIFANYQEFKFNSYAICGKVCGVIEAPKHYLKL